MLYVVLSVSGESYFGEFGHQCAVLESEVFLLTVEFPLKHLILTQQRLHLLQQQPTLQLLFQNKEITCIQEREKEDKAKEEESARVCV